MFAELRQDDAENAGQVDHLQENWAKPMPPFPVEDGYVSGVLQDESGKFNLNSLLTTEDQVNEKAKKYFEKLLQRVGLPAQLSEAVIDWQDADDEPSGAMGAESSYYQGLPIPYLPPNSLFHSAEELKQVRGFEGTKYQQIAPYVVALPKRDTTININTAPALVLASLDEKLDVIAVQNLLDRRNANLEHFSNVNVLWELEGFQVVDSAIRNEFRGLLGVQSQYFKAKIEVVLGERKRQFSSNLVRSEKSVNVSGRSLAPF